MEVSRIVARGRGWSTIHLLEGSGIFGAGRPCPACGRPQGLEGTTPGDDRSTDGALSGLPGADPRLRVLSSPGRGVTNAFNAGFAASSGRFVARMDADDIALPNRLERQARFLEEEPGIDIVVEMIGGTGISSRRISSWR